MHVVLLSNPLRCSVGWPRGPPRARAVAACMACGPALKPSGFPGPLFPNSLACRLLLSACLPSTPDVLAHVAVQAALCVLWLQAAAKAPAGIVPASRATARAFVHMLWSAACMQERSCANHRRKTPALVRRRCCGGAYCLLQLPRACGGNWSCPSRMLMLSDSEQFWPAARDGRSAALWCCLVR